MITQKLKVLAIAPVFAVTDLDYFLCPGLLLIAWLLWLTISPMIALGRLRQIQTFLDHVDANLKALWRYLRQWETQLNVLARQRPASSQESREWVSPASAPQESMETSPAEAPEEAPWAVPVVPVVRPTSEEQPVSFTATQQLLTSPGVEPSPAQQPAPEPYTPQPVGIEHAPAARPDVYAGATSVRPAGQAEEVTPITAASPVGSTSAWGTSQSAQAPPPISTPRPEEPVMQRTSSQWEEAAGKVLRRIWNWIIVGQDYIPAGMSYEFAVAVHWLLRLGVLLLIVGMAYFLQYSVEQGWLPQELRVSVAACVGLGLLIWGTWMFGGRYELLGMGLQGVGLATLYFSAYAAHHWYRLLEEPVAFLLMCFITALAGGIAISLRSLYVALLTLLGGYATPFLFRTAEPQLTALYPYLLLLAIAMVGVSLWQNWPILHLLSFLANYLSVMIAVFDSRQAQLGDFGPHIPWLTALFLTFCAPVWLHNYRRRILSNLLDWLVLLFNSLAYFAICLHLLNTIYPSGGFELSLLARQLAAFITLSLGIFYSAQAWWFLHARREDLPLIHGFMALAAFFIAVTLPLAFAQDWWASSWAIQAIVLLWLAGRVASPFLQKLALGVYVVAIITFSYALHLHYPGSIQENLKVWDYLKQLGQRLLMFGIPLASLVAGARLMLAQDSTKKIEMPERPAPSPVNLGAAFLLGMAILLAFIWLHLEVWRSAGYWAEAWRLPVLTWLYIGIASALLWAYFATSAMVFIGLFEVVTVIIVVKLLLIDDISFWEALSWTLATPRGVPEYRPAPRLVDFLGVIGFLAIVSGILSKQTKQLRDLGVVFLGATLVLSLLFVTAEANFFLEHFLPKFRPGGISLIWGLFALGLIAAGLIYDTKVLRVSGLLLFGLVGCKIFFLDLKDLDTFYQFAALALLGIVALLGSYCYMRAQRLFAGPSSSEAGEESKVEI